ncbi:MAG: NTP transferase domain-containing protein, partial [Stellaceae bacterium]
MKAKPSRFAAIVLAAGEGTRMRSSTPKVLHEVAGRPMIGHVLAALKMLEPETTIVVIGKGQDAV